MTNQNKRPKYLIWLLVFITISIPLIYYFALAPASEGNGNAYPKPISKPTQPEPQFVNEGSLEFISQDGTVTTKINIEVAETTEEKNQGLMHRRSMADSLGMLFIYSQPQPQSFWMKNCHFSQDIIFVDQNLRIVTIQKNTVPFSEKSLPSSQDAQYIVEVVGGFCDRNGIVEGDFIKFDIAV